MKTKKEIEQLAEKEYPIQLNENHYKPDVYDDLNEDNRNAYALGYTKCQEDMADKKYTEEDLRKAWEDGRNNVKTVGTNPFVISKFQYSSFNKWFEQFKKK